MSKTRILLVEDERNFGLVMRDYLQVNGYAVTWCENGLLALAAFQKGEFDICIADVMMPQMDGFTFVEEVRKGNTGIPVLFLTARSMREDMLRGYRAGADDYVIKPFDTEVLLLKLDRMLRRSHLTEERLKEFRFSSFSFSSDSRELKHDSGTTCKLSPKESELLTELLQSRNRPVSRSLLLNRIWKEETYFTGRSMDVYVVKLRKYLESDPRVQLQNIHGSGYCLKCQD